MATTLGSLNAERIELADEPVYQDATWVSTYRTDPFEVSTADKVALLGEYSGRLLAADGVDHATAAVICVKEQTFYADTFGSAITNAGSGWSRTSTPPPSTPPAAPSRR